MVWPLDPRPAKSLIVLEDQIRKRWPSAPKDAIVMIGDEAHQATKSDHNPDKDGVVRAMDVDHLPGIGLNSRAVAQALLDSRDPRIAYVISNGEMARSYPKTGTVPWQWSKYTGLNDHSHHFHLSVVADKLFYDNRQPWNLDAAAPVKFTPTPAPVPIVVKPVPGRMMNIIATEFGGATNPEHSAYDKHLITDTELGVSLPDRFAGERPRVRVWRGGHSMVAPIIDVGPWNISDPYWKTGTRPQSETGIDLTGRKTNKAGIDLTPATMDALGVPGPRGTRSAVIDWEFVRAIPAPQRPPLAPAPLPAPTPAPTQEPSMDLFKFLPLLMRILQIMPQIQDAMKSGTSIFALLQKFAPDLIGILSGIGGSLFPTLPADSQAKIGGLMMDPVKVRLIQGQINKLGLANPPLWEDGLYGPRTKEAVIAFQTAHNVTPVDGWAGDITTAALQTEVNKLVKSDPAAPSTTLSLAIPT
jgi:hypothetical protein